MPSSANNTASPSPNTMSRNNSPRPGAAAGGASMRQLAHRHTATPARRANVGSATQTITPPDSSSDRSVSPDPLVLRLRGAHDATASSSSRGHRRRITWAEDVIDNEGLGRKSSKVCCIYHKPREFGESSSEDDSSSSESDSDSGADDGGARMSGNRRGRSHGHGHGHKHSDDYGKGLGKGKRKPSPNAYEKMPKYQGKQPVVKR